MSALTIDEAWNKITLLVSKWDEDEISLTEYWEKKKKDIVKILGHIYKNKREGPVKPRSGFILYCKDKRKLLRTKLPMKSAQEITKELGKMWKKLNVTEKEHYKEKAKQDKIRYERECMDESRKNKIQSKRKTLYITYCKRERGNIQQQMPDASSREVTEELKKKWSILTDKQKKKYIR